MVLLFDPVDPTDKNAGSVYGEGDRTSVTEPGSGLQHRVTRQGPFLSSPFSTQKTCLSVRKITQDARGQTGGRSAQQFVWHVHGLTLISKTRNETTGATSEVEASKSKPTHPAGTVPSSSLKESRADRWMVELHSRNRKRPKAFSSHGCHTKSLGLSSVQKLPQASGSLC